VVAIERTNVSRNVTAGAKKSVSPKVAKEKTMSKSKAKLAGNTDKRLSRPDGTAVTPEERYAMIAHAAYLRAAARGFAPGNELDDWLAAEADVEGRFAAR